MPSTIDLKIVEDYRGSVLVIGTLQTALAAALLPPSSMYRDAVAGWFVRADGRWGLLSDSPQRGSVAGVQFHDVVQPPISAVTAHSSR